MVVHRSHSEYATPSLSLPVRVPSLLQRLMLINCCMASYMEQAQAATPGGEGFDICLEMMASSNLALDFPRMKTHGRVGIIGSKAEVKRIPQTQLSLCYCESLCPYPALESHSLEKCSFLVILQVI